MLTRRTLLQMAAAAMVAGESLQAKGPAMPRSMIVDTNVNLFHWPFRRLPLDETGLLVKKLKSLGIASAWAGSFEGVLHRDVAGVNHRLAEECKNYPELIPIGTINLAVPDWKDDLRRCVETHKMPGVRLIPGYHGYTLDDPAVRELLQRAAKSHVFVQIAAAMEDTRTQHPAARVPNVDFEPLPKLVNETDGLRVQVLNLRPRGQLAESLVQCQRISFDTSRMDGTDGVPNLAKQVGADRVLFGSHAPFLIPEAALVRVHESSQLDGSVLNGIYQKNAASFAPTISMPRNVEGDVPETVNSLGLPAKDYHIWDSYFTPSHSHPGADGKSRLLDDIERALPAINKGRFEKLCYFAHPGIGTTGDADVEKKLRANSDLVEAPLKRWPNLLWGMIQLNPKDVPASLEAIDRWIGNGPMLGAYFSGAGPASLACTHKNYSPLIERLGKHKALIMQHVWYKTGGKRGAGESTPADLAAVANEFPAQKFLCAHAGGEWQKGVRAVRSAENVLVETSGFDATAGFMEMAVRELGAERIVFGSHLPSRSLGTELAKVTAAEISEHEKHLILGENYRRILKPILTSKRSE